MAEPVRMTGSYCVEQQCHAKADGVDLYCRVHGKQHTEPPLRADKPFDAICHLCGSCESMRLTDQEYRAVKPRKCERCNGRVFVAPAFETFRPADSVPTRSTRSGFVIRTAEKA